MKNEIDFKKGFEKVIDFVKENTEESNSWITIKYRDVPAISEISSYYSKNIIEGLKKHPNIVYGIDTNTKARKKPLHFRYTTEEEKNMFILTENAFASLNTKTIKYIRTMTNIEKYNELYDILNVVNYLCALECDIRPTNISIKDISNALLEPKSKIERIAKILHDSQILVDKGGYIRLLLNHSELQKANEEDIFSHDTLEPQKHTDSTMKSLEDKIASIIGESIPEIDQGENVIKDSGDIIQNLNSFYKAISDLQDDFKSYLNTQLIDEISAVEEKEEELKEGHTILQKALEDNARLSDEISELKKENEQLQIKLETAIRIKERFIGEVEARLEAFLGEASTEIFSYSGLPSWKKNEKAVTDKFRRNLLVSVTSTVEDILRLKNE